MEFAPGAGLWFVAAFADDAARERWRGPLEGALRLLADSGFGGERSHGWGRAEMPEIADGTLPELIFKSRTKATEFREAEGNAASGGAYWMLSLFHPAVKANPSIGSAASIR